MGSIVRWRWRAGERIPIQTYLMRFGDDEGGDGVDDHDERTCRHGKQLGLKHVETECLVHEKVTESPDPADNSRAKRKRIMS